MPAVGSRLRNKVHLGTGRTTLVGVSISGGHAEFVNRFGIEPENRPGGDVAAVIVERADQQAIGLPRDFGISGLRVVDVDAVKGDVGLVGARSRHIAFAGRAGLQAQQVHQVAGFQWKLRDLLGNEIVPEGCVLGIDQHFLRGGGDFYDFTGSSNFQLGAGVGGLPNQRLNASDGLLFEAFCFDIDAIVAWRDEIEYEGARSRWRSWF